MKDYVCFRGKYAEAFSLSVSTSSLLPHPPASVTFSGSCIHAYTIAFRGRAATYCFAVKILNVSKHNTRPSSRSAAFAAINISPSQNVECGSQRGSEGLAGEAPYLSLSLSLSLVNGSYVIRGCVLMQQIVTGSRKKPRGAQRSPR